MATEIGPQKTEVMIGVRHDCNWYNSATKKDKIHKKIVTANLLKEEFEG